MTAGVAASAGTRPRGAFLRRCARWDAALANAETVLLAILIFGSLAASVVQIALRNLGLPALPETDTAARRALLWIAFLGGSLAAFRGSHLAVDVAEQVLPQRASRVVSAAAALIAAGVTALLTVAAARFVAAELAFGGPASAAAAAVMPLGFLVITLRFLLAAARRLASPDAAPAGDAIGVRPAGGRTASARRGTTTRERNAAADSPSGNPARRYADAPTGKRHHVGGGT